ncbi:metallophosphoesterase [Halomonas sp. S2151]|uniref:metallophosphoesterase n=1 Tax=Halomonas sp. S2151 TaxID=579478 RepID=UPI0006965FB5|nr:metallophosphoesterase [Halomonas sp. S2151]
MPFGVISDSHYHAWTAFAKQNGHINSRLQITIDETRDLAKHLKKAGCDALFHCGDIFHVRGRVAPSVLNPVTDLFAEIVNEIGLKVYLLAGNHDLEFEDSNRIGNSGEALAGTGVHVVSEGFFYEPEHKVLMVPWHAKQQALLNAIAKILADTPAVVTAETTLMIHAPVNEIIPGLPDHGIDPDVLAGFGFKNVFVGHYHNHKEVRPKVYSVGALTHQNWGDVGSKAGYLLVEDDGAVFQFETGAPKFIDMEHLDEEDFDQLEGNYARARIEIEDEKEVAEYRDMLENELDAAAALIMPLRKDKVITRKGATKASLDRLEDSISHFIKDASTIPEAIKDDVNTAVLNTLAEIDHAV